MKEKAVMVREIAESENRTCNALAAHHGPVPAEYQLVVRHNDHQTSSLVFCLDCLCGLAGEVGRALLAVENAQAMQRRGSK